jgi:hypothetical protein
LDIINPEFLAVDCAVAPRVPNTNVMATITALKDILDVVFILPLICFYTNKRSYGALDDQVNYRIGIRIYPDMGTSERLFQQF